MIRRVDDQSCLHAIRGHSHIALFPASISPILIENLFLPLGWLSLVTSLITQPSAPLRMILRTHIRQAGTSPPTELIRH